MMIPKTLSYVRKALSDAGYAPIVTADPEEVLPYVEESRPDLVLLDLMLPGMDGIDLMGDILAVADVPMIFISGYGRDQVVAQAFEAGASDYIVQTLLTNRAGSPDYGQLYEEEASLITPRRRSPTC